MAPKTGSSQQVLAMNAARLRLVRQERQFREACNQIILMNMKLQEVGVRYKRARTNNQRSHRYHLRLRLSVIEGVRNMYYDFAETRAGEIQSARQLLSQYFANIEVDSEEDEV